MPVLAGGTICLMRRQLVGWKSLVIIPLIPGMYAGVNAAAGWPLFSALNSGPAKWVVWVAGAATIGLALLYRQLMLMVVVARREREGVAPASAPVADRPADPAPPVAAGVS
jgi:hypothetical protein